jgi:hypothetical protein
MDLEPFPLDLRKIVQEVIGYLDFSTGNPDPRFLGSLNRLFQVVESGGRGGENCIGGDNGQPPWRRLAELLHLGLKELQSTSEAFRQSTQAAAALRLVFDEVLPAYRQFHADLLFHQSEESLFQPFFIGRVCEAVLAQGPPWDESRRVVQGALARLNDFIGHRPVAVLRSRQKLQPYAHEWVRPIPLFVAGAGVAVGRYHDVVAKALEILGSTDEDLLRQAWFDLEQLEELALDPRAHDFDHPVNRRPNYHFGGWDPHRIDNKGYYRRFVLRQVTLEGLWSRVEQRGEAPYEEMLFEAGSVLAGTMLMGSGITGNGPDAHDSSVTLVKLLPRIAACRDAFYERLLERVTGAHAVRLRAEAVRMRQPFGGARQHLNQNLARRRAEQLQQVHLARLFARMGHTAAAGRQIGRVSVASARMRCDMDCRLATAHLHIDHGRLDEAAGLLPEVVDLLHRAIECGALADPWNILGFGGQFSLFPSPENSVHDHRLDELVDLMNEIFAAYARLQKEAAAAGRADLEQKLSRDLGDLAGWWDQFASTEVGEVEGISGAQTWESAARVSRAVRAWHQGGTAAGDVGFWRQHVEEFHSPEAYALLVETLVEKRDLVASMALLVHWLSQAGEVRLAEGPYSFHDLAIRWLEDLWKPAEEKTEPPHPVAPEERWALTRKFFDYVEANAEQYGEVPRLEAGLPGGAAERSERGRSPGGGPATPDAPEADSADDDESLYSAAYEGVTYRDTTDDDIDSDLMDTGEPATDFELLQEAQRISVGLDFITTLARLWKLTAIFTAAPGTAGPDRDDVLGGWAARAEENQRRLGELLDAVSRFPIAPPRGTFESLVEYDRRRAIKESLLERIIVAAVETGDAARLVRVTMAAAPLPAAAAAWEAPVMAVLRPLLRGQAAEVRRQWPALETAILAEPILYIPTARGGNPQDIVAARNLQQVLRQLLTYLPRLGLLSETYQLIGTIQEMEQAHRPGPGAITEFDRLFEIGCRAIVECLVASSSRWRKPRSEAGDRRSEAGLIKLLESVTELLLRRWLEHSRNIRISVLEAVAEPKHFRSLKRFIRQYGEDLFTQKFMNFGNLRAILQQGVGRWLQWRADEPDADDGHLRLLEDLDGPVSRQEAEQWLEIAIEAVVENYSEYVDYNSTTTQSDRGEMLYTLLDFLRLEASYNRVAWNLKPVAIAHEVLVRAGRTTAARRWQRAVARRCAPWADEHLRRLERLSKQYGMRLPSVAERLEERFVRPLAVDRMRALIRPAIEEIRREQKDRTFQVLEQEVEQFTEQPSGVGFDVPAWLEALEDEVDLVRSRSAQIDDPLEIALPIPQSRLSLDQIRRQIERWKKR